MNNTEITELKSDLFEEEELSDADLSTVVGGGIISTAIKDVEGTANGVGNSLQEYLPDVEIA